MLGMFAANVPAEYGTQSMRMVTTAKKITYEIIGCPESQGAASHGLGQSLGVHFWSDPPL
jgi:hypothetical protein